MKHIPLANYLFCIGKALSPICPSCQQDEESIHHYILHCLTHHRARSTLWHSTGDRDVNSSRLLTKPKQVKAPITFIAETGHFNRHQTAHDEPQTNDTRTIERTHTHPILSFFPRANNVIITGGVFSIFRNDETGKLRHSNIQVLMVEYAQNHLVVARLFKHCVLYVSLNLCSLGSQLKMTRGAAIKSYTYK